MCGIAGIAGRPTAQSRFPLEALAHRGPDACGEWTSPDQLVWLGHRRLSILDLTHAGAQPMASADGRWIVVFNGEVFNFLELRTELNSLGHSFHTDTDTEVVLAAWQNWGPDCLHRFNGMWALALWDTVEKELTLSRDRFGKKPLYYHVRGEAVVFASEVQAIHRYLGADSELDSDVVASICNGSFDWQGGKRTYLKDVAILPAGHCLRWKAGKTKSWSWYRLEPGRMDVPKRFEEQARCLRELVLDACRIRLRSDVPLATCLSGGVDSATITAAIHRGIFARDNRMASGSHGAFTAAFTGTMFDETDTARDVARELGIDLRVKEIVAPSQDRLLQAMRACDGPMHALAFYPIWELYGFIRESGVKVTLDGQGPDEMLGGYYEPIEAGLISSLTCGNLSRAWDIYQTYSAMGETKYRSSKAYARQKLGQVLKRPLSIVKRFVKRMLGYTNPHATPTLEFAQPKPKFHDGFEAELHHEFVRSPLPTILQQYDRCSMAHGVECRMPFLDYRVVEYVFSLPVTSRVGKGYTKLILREAMKGLTPDVARLNRVKLGFNAPLVEWFRGPLKTFGFDIVRSQSFRECPYFDGPRLAGEYEAWQASELPSWSDSWGFWPPMHFVLWNQHLRPTLNHRYQAN